MTVCQPARWKKVASGQADTNSSHRFAYLVVGANVRMAHQRRREEVSAILLECVNDAAHARYSRKIRSMRSQLEVTGQGPDSLFHTMEIVIMAEACFHADTLLARLLMIYLPRMEIKDCRAMLQMIQPL